MNEILDIDRNQQEFETENRQPQTFDEMAMYLLSKENCRVNGKGFAVINLHDYVHLAIESVELIQPEQRKTHLMCKTIKRAMEKVYKAFLDGNIEPVNTRHPKSTFGIYNV